MVRRWSRLKTLNMPLNNFLVFNETKRIFLFKTSVSLKRYNVGITKFKRKSVARRKHYSNWFVYLNTLSKWTNDFRIQKQLIKFQYFNKILLTNAFSYNFTHVRPGFLLENNEFTQFSFLFTMLSKKVYSYLHPFKNFYNILKFFNIAYVFSDSNDFKNVPPYLVPVASEYDTQFFSVHYDNNSIIDIFLLSNYLVVGKLTEYYKIFIFFIYYCIVKR